MPGIPSRMVSPDYGFPELHKIRVTNSTNAILERGTIVFVDGAVASGDDVGLTVAPADGTAVTDADTVQGLLLVMLTMAKAGQEGLAGLYAVVAADTTGLSAGDPVYLKDGATGEFSNAAGSTSGRLVGHVLATGQVLLCPALLRGA